MDAPVPASAPELLATPPGAPDTLEAEPGTSRVTDTAEAAVTDGEIGDFGDIAQQ